MLQQAQRVPAEGEDAVGRRRQAGGQAGWWRADREGCFKVTSPRAVLGACDAAKGEQVG